MIHEGNSKLDFIKIKNLCSLKDTINIIKRKDTEWKKIFEKHVFEERLASNK